jgi:hypothetical protein
MVGARGCDPHLAYSPSLATPTLPIKIVVSLSNFFISNLHGTYAIDNPQAIIAHSRPCLSVVF